MNSPHFALATRRTAPTVYNRHSYKHRICILLFYTRKLKCMEGLLPVDPVVQQERILRKYEHEFAAASAKFTDNIKERTINLLKYVSDCVYYINAVHSCGTADCDASLSVPLHLSPCVCELLLLLLLPFNVHSSVRHKIFRSCGSGFQVCSFCVQASMDIFPHSRTAHIRAESASLHRARRRCARRMLWTMMSMMCHGNHKLIARAREWRAN